MRHDIPDTGTMSEAYPHLIFDNFSTPLGDRVTSILKYLFPVPKEDSKRVITFANNDDHISFRHHVYTSKGKKVDLSEIGPRFEMKRESALPAARTAVPRSASSSPPPHRCRWCTRRCVLAPG